MKKLSVMFAVMVLILASPVFAEKPLGPEEFTSVDELAFAIAAYFPKVQGEVKAVQGDKLTIGLGKKDGLLPGMVLTIWRDGKEILHPVTKAVIGYAEEEVGTVEVASVGDSSSPAVIKKKLKDPRPGDRARITPKKIGLGIVPLRTDRPEIIQGLIERLNELGRFTVLENEKVSAFLKDKKQKDSALIQAMGSAFNLDAVVAVGIYPTEGKYLATARIFYTGEAKPLDTIVAVLNLTTKREALGDVRPFFAPAKESAEKIPDLPLDARYLAVADLDGDGAIEYVFSDEGKLHIFRLDPSGWREVWTETLSSKEKGMQQFHIDVADINGNKRPEIFVTAMLNEKVVSYAVEFQDGAYRRIAELPGFLRVAIFPGKGPVLVGQDYDPAAFFSGTPKEYTWTGAAYVAGPALGVPKGVDLYGFIIADFGEARPLLVAFDDEDRLVVYSGETPVWKSEEKYLAVDTVVTKPVTGLDAVVAKAVAEADKSQKVRIHGRLIALDMDGNGKDDLLLPKNTRAALLGGFKEGEVRSVLWTGARLEDRWAVKDAPGPVLDVQALPQEKGGIKVYALVKVLGGFFKKDAVRVMTYGGN